MPDPRIQMFRDTVVVITGGAGGIGVATAEAFRRESARVVVVDKVVPQGMSSEILSLQIDASDEEAVRQGVATVIKECGGIDVLFNNCGIGANFDIQAGREVVMQDSLSALDQDFDFVISTNLKSAMWFVKYAVPYMPKDETSCIITSSSIWARGRKPGAVAYTASKAALTALALSWAHEFAPIRSVSLLLGAVDTPMFRARPDAFTELAQRALLKRPGRPEEVAAAVLFITSCRYITATEIVLDGGQLDR